GGVHSVIIPGGEIIGDVAATLELGRQLAVDEQLRQRVVAALGLDEPSVDRLAMSGESTVAGSDHRLGLDRQRAAACTQPPGKEAAEGGVLVERQLGLVQASPEHPAE